ncbi:MAG: amidohydrolase family protein [Coriobacteriia bacterium]|nr:amidohydrolase family protein [Coriobacteriia bacterium]MBN2822852.1 amidohydrolase family protein [Coriobacteriia bacterium]
MRIIDFHTHVFRDDIAPTAVPALESQGNLRSVYDGTVHGLLRAMARSGVDISVIQPVATKPGQVCSINDWVAANEDPRIIPFGAMHPDFEDPFAEIARMAEAGLKGFKMHPEHQAFVPDEARLEPVYSAAQEYGMIVLFHAGADEIHSTVHGTPQSFANMLDDHPGMTAVLAHMGGYRQWPMIFEVLAGRDVYFDTAYTLGHLSDEDFVALVHKHGVEHILFGSDGPWTDQAAELEHLRSLSFSADEFDAIVGGNAERLLEL